MILRWRYFIGAVIFAAYLLITHGAPLGSVAAGIAGAALCMWLQGRTSRLS